jgi:PadR family transcriptional regulator, regulatory protein PadR
MHDVHTGAMVTERRRPANHKPKGRPSQDQGPRRVRGFLEPSLLLALHKGDGYGYELAEAIRSLGFEDQATDVSLIYRTLRGLEERQLVESRWETETAIGPARRVYRLTEAGDLYLASWMTDLRETVAAISLFVAHYDRHMAQADGDYHWRSGPRQRTDQPAAIDSVRPAALAPQASREPVKPESIS